MKPQLRDFLAFPLSACAFVMLSLAMIVGTEWTAQQILTVFKKH